MHERKTLKFAFLSLGYKEKIPHNRLSTPPDKKDSFLAGVYSSTHVRIFGIESAIFLRKDNSLLMGLGRH